MALKTFTWCVDSDASQDTELVVNKVQFGDGYEQVSSFGINNTRTSWQLSRTAEKAEVDAIYDFLIEHKGVTPFLMNIEGVVKTYRTEGGISKNHLSADIWQVSFTVKQIFI